MLNPRNWTLRSPLLAALFCAAMAVSGPALAMTPKDTVKRAVDEIIRILKTDGLGTEDRWQRIGDKQSRPTEDGVLAEIDAVESLQGSSDWTLRLIVEHDNGSRRETRYAVNLGQ